MKVTAREHGVIPGCVPVGPNSASSRDTKWPEKQPLVQDYDGEYMSVSALAFVNQMRKDVADSRRMRNAD